MMGDISRKLVPRDDHGIEVPKDACRLHGSIPVDKIKGNFHILSGKAYCTSSPEKRNCSSLQFSVGMILVLFITLAMFLLKTNIELASHNSIRTIQVDL